MPGSRYGEMEELMGQIVPQAKRDWNCQNWVREALTLMVTNGLISDAERLKAEEDQKQAIALPFTSETPNKRALKD